MIGTVLKVTGGPELDAKVKIDRSEKVVVVMNPENDHELTFSNEVNEEAKQEIFEDYKNGRTSLQVFAGDRIKFAKTDLGFVLTKVILTKGDPRNIRPGT